ncbi:MAG: hypothetical protein PWP47_589 [Synergistaceae bacterium]|jgi:hypothetical protein|nr:hypothetical protein [Synergistaceae bacterium]
MSCRVVLSVSLWGRTGEGTYSVDGGKRERIGEARTEPLVRFPERDREKYPSPPACPA